MNHYLFRRTACLFLAPILLLAGCQSGASSSSAAPAVSTDSPEMPNYSLGLTENGLYEGYTALDCVTLPDGYDRIPADESFTTVSEEDLQQAIDQFMSGFATDTQILDRAVEEGDLVNLDYVGYIDGQAFEGGDSQGAGLDYTAGSDQLIDDFLSQIIGAMPGDTLDVAVTFPDPYSPNQELSGKEAVFTTTINYIHGESVTPELTEEFVENYLSYYYGYTSVADMKEKISAELLSEQQYNYVLDWLYENSTFVEVPDKLVEDQISLLRLELENAADSYEITPDELAAQYGVEDLEALLEAYRPSLENMVKQNLMCQAVAEDAGIQVDEQAVSDYFSSLNVSDHSSYVESFGQGYIYQGVRSELVAQYLIDHVVV